MPTRSHAIRFLSLILVFATLTPLACRLPWRRSPNAEDEDLLVSRNARRGPSAKKPGLELEAYASGNCVRIILTNNYPTPVLAGPKLFAVVPKGSRKPVPWDIGVDNHMLPVKSMKRGESIQGVLRFNRMDDLVGARLVFKSLDERISPVYCVVQPFESIRFRPFESDRPGKASSPSRP